MFGGPPPKITEDMKIKKPSSVKEVPGYLKKVIGGFFQDTYTYSSSYGKQALSLHLPCHLRQYLTASFPCRCLYNRRLTE